jgi:hypothetical protein
MFIIHFRTLNVHLLVLATISNCSMQVMDHLKSNVFIISPRACYLSF